MKKVKGFFITLIVLSFVFTLSGCAEAIFHVTVNKDGSSDLNYKIGINSSVLALMSSSSEEDPIVGMSNDMKEKGFTVENYTDSGMSGIIAKKHVKSFEDISSLYSLNGNNSDVTMPKLNVKKGLLFNTYVLDGNLDLSSMKSNTGTGSDAMSNAMLSQINVKFIITLPIKSTINNASAITDDGKTLNWNLIPGSNNKINLEAKAPNIINIVIICIVTIILIITLIFILVKIYRKSKDTNSNLSHEEIKYENQEEIQENNQVEIQVENADENIEKKQEEI